MHAQNLQRIGGLSMRIAKKRRLPDFWVLLGCLVVSASILLGRKQINIQPLDATNLLCTAAEIISNAAIAKSSNNKKEEKDEQE